MENIASFQQPESLFRTHYSVAIRWWHWLTFITITASILMVLFASTLFTTRGKIPMVQEQVQQKGGTISPDQARAVTHEYSDMLWNLHKYIGFGLCFLLLVRIIIEISYSREKRLSGKIRRALAFQTPDPLRQYDRRHYIMVKWGYVIFYALLLIMAVTGLILALEDVPFFRSIRHTTTTIHRVTQFVIYAYIFFHIAGVIRADLTDNKGIVSSMINGGPQ